MTIATTKCDICGEELDLENYYYIATGRLQQGTHSDPKAYKEYTMCTSCYAMINGEFMASVQKHKMKNQEKKKEQ